MSDNIKFSRRSFLASAIAGSALTLPAMKSLDSLIVDESPDIVIAEGNEAVANTEAVITALGGMGKYVGKDQVVGLLPNAQGVHPGCSTNPDIVKTVVKHCKEAGAAKVLWYTWLPERAWTRSNLKVNVEASGAELVYINADDADQWKTFEIAEGKALKQVRIFKALYECDFFISMPIVKDHIGSRFTGVLKNYMGASHPKDNRPFHPTFEGDDLLHMEQCIADLNLVARKPDMIIMDAMQILTSNGPFGPGKIATPNKVIGGFDRVAVDSFAATILGLKGPEVRMIANAAAHGLGEIDYSKLNVKSVAV